MVCILPIADNNDCIREKVEETNNILNLSKTGELICVYYLVANKSRALMINYIFIILDYSSNIRL